MTFRYGFLAALVILAATTCACRQNEGAIEVVVSKPVIEVIRPTRGTVVHTIDLPGDLVGFYEAALHAKVTGYLQMIGVDKGDWVKAGTLLATIQVPELHSNLEHAQADMELAKITYERLHRVQQSDPRLVALEDVDIAYARYLQAKATVRTLQTMVDYTRIVAPFDGVITGRFADPGALIRAGGGDIGVNETSGLVSPGATEGSGGHRSGGGPVLTIAAIDRLRVYIYVPERECVMVRRNEPATLRLDEFPGRVFHGSVARYASALDLATRTMMTEIDIDNPDHRLYPRMYAHVILELARNPNALELPISAIGGLDASPFVYVVRDGRLVKQVVTTGFNDGAIVEIVSGLAGRELVAKDVNPTLHAGEEIESRRYDPNPVGPGAGRKN